MIGRVKLVADMEVRIPCDVIVRVGAKQDPCRGVVVGLSFPFVVHLDVHIHLADVLVRELARLQIDQHEAFENVVIENKIDEVVFFLGADPFLAGDEGVSFA